MRILLFVMKGFMLVIFLFFAFLAVAVYGYFQGRKPYAPFTDTSPLFVFANVSENSLVETFPDAETKNIFEYLVGKADLSEDQKLAFLYFQKDKRTSSMSAFEDSLRRAGTPPASFFLSADVPTLGEKAFYQIYTYCGSPKLRFEPDPNAEWVYAWGKTGWYNPLTRTFAVKSIFEKVAWGDYYRPDLTVILTELPHALQFKEKKAFAYTEFLFSMGRVVDARVNAYCSGDSVKVGVLYDREYDRVGSFEYDAHTNIERNLDTYFFMAKEVGMAYEDENVGNFY